jgi:dynein intermediate chain, cytosolic
MVSTSVNPTASRGLNRLAWDKRDGRKVAIGSSDGKLYVYEVAAELTNPRESEWDNLRKVMGGFGNQK